MENNNEKLMKVMKRYFEHMYPDIKPPLKVRRHAGKGNRGYGSAMDDYTFINLSYHTEDGEEIFYEYDDNTPYSDNKWNVSDRLEELYNLFGESDFENFIEWYFGYNIKDKGNRKYNWLLV